MVAPFSGGSFAGCKDDASVFACVLERVADQICENLLQQDGIGEDKGEPLRDGDLYV